MPDRDGSELLRGLRAEGFDADKLPAIALTALLKAQIAITPWPLAQDCLTKPVAGEVLISRVAKLLRSRKDKPAA